MRITTGLLSAALCLVLPCQAADESYYEFASSAASAEVPAELAPLLQSEYRDDRGRYSILRRISLEIDGDRVIDRVVSITRYQTHEEAASSGNSTIYLDTSASTLSIDHALVVPPGAQLQVVDPETVQVVDDNEDLVFSDDVGIVIPWPALEPGAITVLAYTRTVDTSKLAMPWSRTFFPAALSHIEQYELDVRWQEDESAPLWSSSTEANGCKLASTTHLRCRAQSIAAVENDEVVLWLDHVAQIVVASPASWQDLAQIVGRYVEQARTADDAIVSKARSLVSGIGAERERLDAIHEFVAREIRYVGLEHGQYSHVPKPSDVTLARRYGDCKDKTTLLIDMLAAVGIEASPVLVATDRFDPSRLDVPAAGYFDHLIACGRLSNGAPFCLDPTDAYSEAASLGGSIQGAVSLPINDEPQPTTLPSDSYRWVLTEQADMLVTAEGHLEETLRLQYEGPYAASLRANLSGLVESELVDWAEETYADVVSTMTTPSFEFAGLDEIEPTLQVNSEASYKKLVAPDEDLNYREDLPWLDRLLGYFITNNEHYYYDFPGVRYESEVRFKIARTWTPDRTGPRVEFRGEFGNLARRYEIDGNLVTIKTMVGMPKRRIEVEEMEAFNDFISKLREHNHFRILATLD